MEQKGIFFLWRGKESWQISRDIDDKYGVPLSFPYWASAVSVLADLRGRYPAYSFETRLAKGVENVQYR